jgi:hypothetical protein
LANTKLPVFKLSQNCIGWLQAAKNLLTLNLGGSKFGLAGCISSNLGDSKFGLAGCISSNLGGSKFGSAAYHIIEKSFLRRK